MQNVLLTERQRTLLNF